jgi:hypothetical protein
LEGDAKALIHAGQLHFLTFDLLAGLGQQALHAAADSGLAAQLIRGIKGGMEGPGETGDGHRKNRQSDDDFK